MIILIILIHIHINKWLLVIIFNVVAFQLLGKLEWDEPKSDNQKAQIES